MRDIDDIRKSGAAWITESELEYLCDVHDIREMIWGLLGFHQDTEPKVIYDAILELRSYARQVPKL